MNEGALQLFLFCGIHAVVFILLVTVQPFANRCAYSSPVHHRIHPRVHVHNTNQDVMTLHGNQLS